jgi:hypothetical protein
VELAGESVGAAIAVMVSFAALDLSEYRLDFRCGAKKAGLV